MPCLETPLQASSAEAGASAAPRETLLAVQLSVARRADALVRRYRGTPFGDRRMWLRAELEVFEQLEAATRGEAGSLRRDCAGRVTAR